MKYEEGQWIVPRSVVQLWHGTRIMQFVIIGGNYRKGPKDLSTLFLLTTYESTIISK